MIDGPKRRVWNDGCIGASGRSDAVIEIGPHRRDPARALWPPVAHQTRAGEIQMILHRHYQAQRPHARELFFSRDETVLDGPTLSDDGVLGIGSFVSGQYFVDRRIA